MALDDVTDLMTENARQLIRSTRCFDQSTIHVDESTGQRKGIDLV